jgi:hypothetical protein
LGTADQIPLKERAKRYRASAIEALRQADSAEDQWQRNAYINLARNWHAMAVQLEEALDRLSEEVESPRDGLKADGRSAAGERPRA